MKLLHANDVRGQHANSWYAATSDAAARPRLERHVEADVCIVGGGFTGLAAARELARRGRSVVLLEAHRVGWGASGRNGGQLGSGYNLFQKELESSVGETRAHALWDIAERGKAMARELDGGDVDLQLRPGIILAAHRARDVAPLHAAAAHLARHYDYREVEPLDRAALRERVASDGYHGGVLDRGSAHLHPLRLAQALAADATAAGADLFERSEVLRIDGLDVAGDRERARAVVAAGSSAGAVPRLVTAAGSVRAGHVILAANGYLDGLVSGIGERVMPINNFIIVTEPLGERAKTLLPGNEAVADTRFVVNYYRRTPDDRLLFGGGESYGHRFPGDMARRARRAMLRVFPSLADVRTEYVWGGTLAITPRRLPHVARIGRHAISAGGYSGHGVGLALATGEAVAAALDGDDRNLTHLADLPGGRFPGGAAARSALLALAMTGASWLDRL